jgi:hypothetical protein
MMVVATTLAMMLVATGLVCALPMVACSQIKRIEEFEGKWINTNMPDYPAANLTPRHDVIEVKSADGGHTRKVGLLGLMTADSDVHRSDAFGNAVRHTSAGQVDLLRFFFACSIAVGRFWC